MDLETGYWVMQYVPPEQFTRPLTFDSFPISVTVFPVGMRAPRTSGCHWSGARTPAIRPVPA